MHTTSAASATKRVINFPDSKTIKRVQHVIILWSVFGLGYEFSCHIHTIELINGVTKTITCRFTLEPGLKKQTHLLISCYELS